MGTPFQNPGMMGKCLRLIPTTFFSFSSIAVKRKSAMLALHWFGQPYFLRTHGVFLGRPGEIILSSPRKIRQEVPYGNNPDDFLPFSYREMSHPKIPHFILRIQKSLCGVDAIQ